jgi:signal transduction histidine kinase
MRARQAGATDHGAPVQVRSRERSSVPGAEDLALFYLWVVVVSSTAFIVLVTIVAWSGWLQQREEQTDLADVRVRESAVRLDARMKDVREEVLQLRQWATDLPLRPDRGTDPVLERTLRQSSASSADGTITLDDLRRLPVSVRPAQVVALTSSTTPVADGAPSPLDLARLLADRLGSGQATAALLHSSFFLGARGDVYASAPWAPSRDVVGSAGTVRAFLRDAADRVPGAQGGDFGELAWTEPHSTPDGALALTASASVVWGDTRVGTVGTRVTLDFLADFLGQFPEPEGELFVVDERGTVVGRRGGAVPTDATALESLTDLYPGVRLPEGNGASTRWSTDDVELFLTSVEDPALTVVYAMPRATISDRGLADFTSQLLLAIALLLAMMLLQYVLWRTYVSPALAIAAFVEEATRTRDPEEPAVPSRWRPRVSALAEAFAERASLLAELESSRADLEESVGRRTAELDAERAAAETQATLLSVVLEGVQDGVMVVDAQGRIRVHNLAARTMLGQAIPIDRPVDSWEQTFGLRPADPALARVRRGFPSVFLRGDARSVDSVLVPPGQPDAVRHVRVDARRLNGTQGQFLVLLHDMTGERARHRELQDFAGTVAHDLKSPLTALTGWLQYAAELAESDPGQARSSLQRAARAGERMRQVIDDWLAYTVTREGVLQPAPIVLDQCLLEVLSVYADREGELDVDVPHTVLADPSLLRQLLANLVANAWKYTRPDEAPSVTVRSAPAAEPGWVEVSVADRGVGIQPGDEERIFLQFERSEKDASTHVGTGLGLALCRAIVARHGGRIWVEHRDGGGAVFRFTLPEVADPA